MKKTLAILVLTALPILGFSQVNNTIRDRVFQRIEREREFGKCFFPEYCIGDSLSRENGGEYIVAWYDFNHDGRPDLFAHFKPDTLVNYSEDCTPRGTKRNAEVVMTSDGKVYSDLDENGSLEDADKFYKEGETPESFLRMVKPDIPEEIFNDIFFNPFDQNKYEKYWISSERLGDYITKHYDFNGDGDSDFSAKFKIIGKNELGMEPETERTTYLIDVPLKNIKLYQKFLN